MFTVVDQYADGPTPPVQATLNLHAAAHRPDIYRRVLGILLDGLRPARAGVTALPVEPLADDELHAPT